MPKLGRAGHCYIIMHPHAPECGRPDFRAWVMSGGLRPVGAPTAADKQLERQMSRGGKRPIQRADDGSMNGRHGMGSLGALPEVSAFGGQRRSTTDIPTLSPHPPASLPSREITPPDNKDLDEMEKEVDKMGKTKSPRAEDDPALAAARASAAGGKKGIRFMGEEEGEAPVAGPGAVGAPVAAAPAEPVAVTGKVRAAGSGGGVGGLGSRFLGPVGVSALA